MDIIKQCTKTCRGLFFLFLWIFFWEFISYSQFFHLILSLPFPNGDIFPYQVDKLAYTAGLSLKRHLEKYRSFTWRESETDWSPELMAIVSLLHLGSPLPQAALLVPHLVCSDILGPDGAGPGSPMWHPSWFLATNLIHKHVLSEENTDHVISIQDYAK